MPTRLKLYLGFFVVFLIATIILSYPWGGCGATAWLREAGNVRHAERTAKLFAADLGRLPPDDQPLSELIHTAYEDFDSSASDHDYQDMWGNPYRCVRITEGGSTRLGVYSSGEDGISRSLGNDPDDLNSWNENGRSHYEKKDRAAALRACGMMSLYLAGLSVLVSEFFLAIARANRRKAEGC